MDAFFAAVEERNNQHLVGRPVVIGADPKKGMGRGVVSTANYEARKHGVRSGMPISEAWRRCPHAAFLIPDIDLYTSVSDRIFSALSTLVEKESDASSGKEFSIERASIDEFCVEARGFLWEESTRLAEAFKNVIREGEQLTCSVGVGPNPLVAKIASDFEKPNGLTMVKLEDVMDFLGFLPVRKIPGIGPKTERILADRGIKIISDLRKMTHEELVQEFGKWGGGMYERARGIDETRVGIQEDQKSIGEQETFERDTRDWGVLTERLLAFCEDVWERMQREQVAPRTVVITVRFADFETKTRSRTLANPARSLETFKQEALALLMPFFDSRENPQHKAIRLIGVRGEKLLKS